MPAATTAAAAAMPQLHPLELVLAPVQQLLWEWLRGARASHPRRPDGRPWVPGDVPRAAHPSNPVHGAVCAAATPTPTAAATACVPAAAAANVPAATTACWVAAAAAAAA